MHRAPREDEQTREFGAPTVDGCCLVVSDLSLIRPFWDERRLYLLCKQFIELHLTDNAMTPVGFDSVSLLMRRSSSEWTSFASSPRSAVHGTNYSRFQSP